MLNKYKRDFFKPPTTYFFFEKIKSFEKSISELEKALGAEVVATVPMCKHGDMTLKEGTGKTGKPYRGYVCTAPKAEQCSPIWQTLTSQGTWRDQDERDK